tara:strand:- start:866 stop:1171 length:306 start_codon:yes stop_codon:yes gene_type:complete
MLSKKESTIDKLRSDSKNGIHPKIATLNQDKAVRRKAFCKFSFLFSSRFVRTKSIPINIVIVVEDKNDLFSSPYVNWRKSGIIMNVPNIIRSTPIAKKTVL